jgi:hydrogenase maturation protein HypF
MLPLSARQVADDACRLAMTTDHATPFRTELIRVRGLVQGVGFRPTVWRLARQYGLRGWVSNDGAGVAALVCGNMDGIDSLIGALRDAPPPLARIDAIER